MTTLLKLTIVTLSVAICEATHAADYEKDQAIDRELGLLTRNWAISPAKFLNWSGIPKIFQNGPPYFQQPTEPMAAPAPVVPKVEPRVVTPPKPAPTPGSRWFSDSTSSRR